MQDVILELKGIDKSFGPIQVLEGIDLVIEKGKVYVLAGENGAGKSTLCNLISGSLKPDHGSFCYEGKDYNSLSIEMAKQEIGVRMVHQELQVIPMMTIMENIFIGDEMSKGGFVKKQPMNEKARRLLREVGLDMEPDTLVRDVEISGRQMIEIARGINGQAKLIILDEPTSSLSQAENEKLFAIVKKLKAQGISFIFISHRLEEALEIGDVIVVLKDGKKVIELDARRTDQDEIIKYMVGRNYDDYYNRKREFYGKEILRLENVSAQDTERSHAYSPKNITLSLQEGEVLGIAGLVGAGRTELIRTLFGDMKMESGTVYVEGKEVRIQNSADALKLGMAWVTEDRKTSGVILGSSIELNTGLVVLKRFVKRFLIHDRKVRELSREYMEKLRIKATGPEQRTATLSGGNQQKVVLAKWLAAKPRILVLDEPTRGIDVGAKTEIYKLINKLTAQGIAVIMISSELPEVIGMSDRMLIMYEGKITSELMREDFSEERVMRYATGRRMTNG